jgi:hypothetical protein
VLTNPGLLVSQSLRRRTRLPAQHGKVETGQKERGVFHAGLSQASPLADIADACSNRLT